MLRHKYVANIITTGCAWENEVAILRKMKVGRKLSLKIGEKKFDFKVHSIDDRYSPPILHLIPDPVTVEFFRDIFAEFIKDDGWDFYPASEPKYMHGPKKKDPDA